jgi:hypothetical protein
MNVAFYVDCSRSVRSVPSGGSVIILEEYLPESCRYNCHAHSATSCLILILTVPELNYSYLVSKENVVKIPVSSGTFHRLQRR